jgi:hypothetical protein
MTELPDPHWKQFPEVDYDRPEELETVDEIQDRQFDEYEDSKYSDQSMLDWIEDLR